MTQRTFDHLGRTSADWAGIARTFLGTLLAIGPAALAIFASDYVRGTAYRKVYAIAAIASLLWEMGCIWLQGRGEQRVYAQASCSPRI